MIEDNGGDRQGDGDFEDALHPHLPEGVEWSVNRKTATEFLAIFYDLPQVDVGRLSQAVELALSMEENRCLHAYTGEPVSSLQQLHLSYNSAKSAMCCHTVMGTAWKSTAGSICLPAISLRLPLCSITDRRANPPDHQYPPEQAGSEDNTHKP